MTPETFRAILHPILFRFNGSVTGGMRSFKRNELKGGDANSRHLQDMAEDIALDNPINNQRFIDECKRQGLLAVPGKADSNFVHVQVP